METEIMEKILLLKKKESEYLDTIKEMVLLGKPEPEILVFTKKIDELNFEAEKLTKELEECTPNIRRVAKNKNTVSFRDQKLPFWFSALVIAAFIGYIVLLSNGQV